MRKILETLNTPKAVLVVLALFVVIDGSVYFLYPEPPVSSSTLSARTERTDSTTTSAEETSLVGTANADKYVGTSGNDKLFGDAGADELYAGSGDDELFGGLGADYLNADDQEGGDILKGGDGEDYCDGDQTEDTFVSCEKRE